jgi:hypothetical protein
MLGIRNQEFLSIRFFLLFHEPIDSLIAGDCGGEFPHCGVYWEADFITGFIYMPEF